MPWDTSDRASRLPAGWSRVTVPRILARDHGICYLCGRPGADEVDHVRPGDDHRDTNLAAVHGDPCHRAKTAREGGTAWAARRAQGRHPGERHPGAV